MRSGGLRALGAAVVVGLAAAAMMSVDGAVAARGALRPVPSLEPAKTAREWRQVAARPHVRALRAGECRPIRLVFYAATDWLRLATKLAATASPCAQYYVSVPPLAGDKTQSRADQAWRIRALGQNMHALAEVNMNAWAGWVTNTGGSWYGAGVEARRRLAAAGYDTVAGDFWAVNEFSSAVRRGDGSARANARDFVRGLHDGDGSRPPAKGVVFIAGMSQATTNLSVYQQNLQSWLTDSAFWEDMARYVRDWSQEQYADVRNVAVPAADLATRRDALVDYLDHELVLARVGPTETAAARAFLETASSPVANAAWQWESGFGWTNVNAELMKHFVSTQVYALRHFRATALPTGVVGTAGFAWAPRNATAASDFTAKSAEVLERLAAAIRDSGYDAAPEDPAAAACASVWCAGEQPGGWLNAGWQSFRAWQVPPPPADTTPPETSIGSGPTGSMTATSAAFEFSSTEAGSRFECRLDGAVYGSCTSPKSYSDLGTGPHLFEVRAVDAAGNADPTPAARAWTVEAAAADPTNLLVNGSFEGSSAGWASWNGSLSLVAGGVVGSSAGRLVAAAAGSFGVASAPRPVSSTLAGSYSVGGSLRATVGRRVCLYLRDWLGGSVVRQSAHCLVGDGEWQQWPAATVATAAGDSLDVVVIAPEGQPGDSFDLDGLTLSHNAPSGGLLGNGGFEGSPAGWAAWNGSVSVVAAGLVGSAGRVVATGAGSFGLASAPRPVSSTVAGSYGVSGWLQAQTGGRRVCLYLREWAGASVVRQSAHCLVGSGEWQQWPAVTVATASGNSLDVVVIVPEGQPGDSFDVDGLTLTHTDSNS